MIVIDALIARNHSDLTMVLEETYLSLCLKRIFRLGVDGHVDLRNPNPVGIDYLVIHHDGALYPTDEARMLTRSGVVDLTMGHVRSGIDLQRQNLFNANTSNFGDPDCDRCTYQPYCGRDFIDDLSRYGRIDLPRHESFFCQKHLHIFDLCMRLIYSEEAAVQYSLAKWLGLAGNALPLQPYAL
jgi:radical SAM protein with 4Fe4S-binding SPASM domain